MIDTLIRYDRINLPKKFINKDGTIKYIYQRKKNEPSKTVQELEQIINNPPDKQKYINFIKKAFLIFFANGINVQINDIKEIDIAALWIYKEKTIVIDKEALKRGSKDFANLISHEMIHISQSCKGGGLNFYPVLLGLNINRTNNFYSEELENKIYKNLNENQLKLEIEAYSNQANLLQTIRIFKYFCLKKR